MSYWLIMLMSYLWLLDRYIYSPMLLDCCYISRRIILLKTLLSWNYISLLGWNYISSGVMIRYLWLLEPFLLDSRIILMSNLWVLLKTFLLDWGCISSYIVLLPWLNLMLLLDCLTLPIIKRNNTIVRLNHISTNIPSFRSELCFSSNIPSFRLCSNTNISSFSSNTSSFRLCFRSV